MSANPAQNKRGTGAYETRAIEQLVAVEEQNAELREKLQAAVDHAEWVEQENDRLRGLLDAARPPITEALNCSAHSWHSSDDARRWLLKTSKALG